MWLSTLMLSLRSIRRNLMRSFLTILGIVIGVSAVITMVTLGNGATLAVQTQISSLGTNLLQVRPGQRMGPGGGTGAQFRVSKRAASGLNRPVARLQPGIGAADHAGRPVAPACDHRGACTRFWRHRQNAADLLRNRVGIGVLE